jgi:site-specific DNA recombinase
LGAARLEAFVADAAVELLTHLDVSGAPSAATALSTTDETAISADEAELAELKDMWASREISTREYRQMRKTVEDRITTLRRKTIVRPTVEVLAGLVGPDARTAWDRLADSGDVERLNAVLRFLFAA